MLSKEKIKALRRNFEVKKRQRGIRQRLYEKQGGRCHLCGKKTYLVAPLNKGDLFTVDHIIPLSLGGTSANDNLIGACLRCNSGKGCSIWRNPAMREAFDMLYLTHGEPTMWRTSLK